MLKCTRSVRVNVHCKARARRGRWRCILKPAIDSIHYSTDATAAISTRSETNGHSRIYANSVRTEGLQFKVSSISWDRQNPKGVRVAETALPPLDGDDGRTSFDDVQPKSILQSETNAIVNLSGKHTQDALEKSFGPITHVFLPLTLGNTAGLGVPEWVTSTVQVDLTGSLLVAGHWTEACRINTAILCQLRTAYR